MGVVTPPPCRALCFDHLMAHLVKSAFSESMQIATRHSPGMGSVIVPVRVRHSPGIPPHGIPPGKPLLGQRPGKPLRQCPRRAPEDSQETPGNAQEISKKLQKTPSQSFFLLVTPIYNIIYVIY